MGVGRGGGGGGREEGEGGGGKRKRGGGKGREEVRVGGRGGWGRWGGEVRGGREGQVKREREGEGRGVPLVSGLPVPPPLLPDARETVRACPLLALRLERVNR